MRQGGNKYPAPSNLLFYRIIFHFGRRQIILDYFLFLED